MMNRRVKDKVKKLEERVVRREKVIDCENIKREKDFQAALQYDRLNSIVISAIPPGISDELDTNRLISLIK